MRADDGVEVVGAHEHDDVVARDAGVVHDDAERAELGFDAFDHGGHGRFVANVAHDVGRGDAERLDLGDVARQASSPAKSLTATAAPAAASVRAISRPIRGRRPSRARHRRSGRWTSSSVSLPRWRAALERAHERTHVARGRRGGTPSIRFTRPVSTAPGPTSRYALYPSRQDAYRLLETHRRHELALEERGEAVALERGAAGRKKAGPEPPRRGGSGRAARRGAATSGE